METVIEKWPATINTVTIGAESSEGGTRSSTVTIGGETTLPFLSFEGAAPHRPALALDILDYTPDDWPKTLCQPYGSAMDHPTRWAKFCQEEYRPDLICLHLQSLHPDWGDTPPKQAAETVKAVLEATSLPLIIAGCDHPEKDNQAFPLCAAAAAGENCLIGFATEENYKTLTAACLADNHSIWAQSPIDINIAKQVNILITEMGFNPQRIVIDPNTGALGYGIEYTYSIMERIRLAALDGDKMLAMPMLGDIGADTWRAKEAKAAQTDFPEWGEEALRGPLWEAVTATLLLQSGADLIIFRHPEALKKIREHLDRLFDTEIGER